MGWREYLYLFEKYEGNLDLANEREIEHADRGIAPQIARQIAEAEYERKERKQKNEHNQQKNRETHISDNRFGDCLF